MTHKQAVLNLLSDRKPHSHHELYSLGCVAHSRISDLRKDGWKIDQWREDGLYLYRLRGRLDEAAASLDAVRDGTGSTAASSSAPPNPGLSAGSQNLVPSAPGDASVSTLGRDGGALLLFDEHDQATVVYRGAYAEDVA